MRCKRAALLASAPLWEGEEQAPPPPPPPPPPPAAKDSVPPLSEPSIESKTERLEVDGTEQRSDTPRLSINQARGCNALRVGQAHAHLDGGRRLRRRCWQTADFACARRRARTRKNPLHTRGDPYEEVASCFLARARATGRGAQMARGSSSTHARCGEEPPLPAAFAKARAALTRCYAAGCACQAPSLLLLPPSTTCTLNPSPLLYLTSTPVPFWPSTTLWRPTLSTSHTLHATCSNTSLPS